MDDYPILYSFRRCPYAMRARMGMIVSGVQFELREIILKDKPEAMLQASPKGTVPVLILPDGGVLEESLDVLFWALAQHDPEGWRNIDIATADNLIAQNDGAFKRALDRYKYPNRYEDEGTPQTPYKDQGIEFLMKLEKRLNANAHLMGDRLSYADVAIFPFVRQFAHVDYDWFLAQDLPQVQKWLDNRLQSVLFKTIMQKHPIWDQTSMGVVCGG